MSVRLSPPRCSLHWASGQERSRTGCSGARGPRECPSQLRLLALSCTVTTSDRSSESRKEGNPASPAAPVSLAGPAGPV